MLDPGRLLDVVARRVRPGFQEAPGGPPGVQEVALESAGSTAIQVSAAVCGDDSFAIDSIQWSCEPNKD